MIISVNSYNIISTIKSNNYLLLLNLKSINTCNVKYYGIITFLFKPASINFYALKGGGLILRP